MIIETTCNHFYRVVETGDPDLAHVWIGVRVKKTKAGYVDIAKPRRMLVRKEGSKIISH